MDKNDTPKVIEALSDENAQVRTETIDILKEVGDERALKPLFYVAWFDEYEGQMIDMGEYGLRTFPLRDKAREALNQIVVRAGESAIEPLIELLADTNPDYRITAANLLGSIYSSKAIQQLISALRDEQWNVRDAAYSALWKIHHPDSTEPLITFMASQLPEKRKETVELLGYINDKRAANPLADVVNENPDIEIRIEAAWALHQMGDDRGLGYINSLVDELLIIYNVPRYPHSPYGNDFASINRIHLIGRAFCRFGGIPLMKQSFKRFRKADGNKQYICLDLNDRWDGICGWSAQEIRRGWFK